MKCAIGFVLTGATLGAMTLPAQSKTIVVGDGWEAFPYIEYVGGHAQHARRIQNTVLVLTDSALSLFACKGGFCDAPNGQRFWGDSAIFVVSLSALTAIEVKSQVRSASVGSKIMWGALANDRAEEYLGLAFETETSAEAPMFKTKTSQAGALDAKIRFRLRKMGRSLTPADTSRVR